MSSVKVRTVGPLFDAARREGALDAGIDAGLRRLVPQVEARTREKFSASGIPAGRFLASIQGEVREGIGNVSSSDPRRLRTWLETGRRRGVKTRRKGAYGWRAGKKVAKDLNKQGFFAEEIARRLNGG